MKTLTLMLGLMLSTTALAEIPVGVRAAAQQARISEGVASGELTGREAARLERREQHLRREIRRDRLDGGGLSGRERRHLQREENRISRGIYRQKHDGQVR
jgi:hypothetical protein